MMKEFTDFKEDFGILCRDVDLKAYNETINLTF